MKKILLIYGLNCSGKSTFCDYICEKYNAVFLHIRRFFKSKYPIELYRKMLSEHGNSYWLDFISDDLSEYKKHDLLIIEGFFTMDEAAWCNNFFDADIHIIYIESDVHVRIDRRRKRENIDRENAEKEIAASDEYRISRGLFSVKENAGVVLENDKGEMNFKKQIGVYLDKIC